MQHAADWASRASWNPQPETVAIVRKAMTNNKSSFDFGPVVCANCGGGGCYACGGAYAGSQGGGGGAGGSSEPLPHDSPPVDSDFAALNERICSKLQHGPAPWRFYSRLHFKPGKGQRLADVVGPEFKHLKELWERVCFNNLTQTRIHIMALTSHAPPPASLKLSSVLYMLMTGR